MPQYIGREREFTITDDQIYSIYEVLVNKSWRNGIDFEAYQDAWITVSALLGIDMPYTPQAGCLPPKSISPAVACPDCQGSTEKCKTCSGNGWVHPRIPDSEGTNDAIP